MDEKEIDIFWKDIADTMNDGLILIEPDGVVAMVNRATAKLTGYQKEELIGMHCTILGCEACEIARSAGEGQWCILFSEGRFSMKKVFVRKKDGTYVPVLKNASLLRDENGVVKGAVETLTDLSEIDKRDRRIEELSRILNREDNFHGIVGRTPAMRQVFEVVEKAAKSEAHVLLRGESGTGKELVARAIHERGLRKDGPFVELNCAALNESLLESELFGHEKGAFTGAIRERKGRFEAAHGGDFFLDEIGDVPLSVQAKLLRVLETRTFERVGSHRRIFADVRIISATNQDLEKLTDDKKFRSDLFFRINVVPIHLPPLRERREDIPLLVESLMRELRIKTGKNVNGLSRAAMECFMEYPWPGNIRELKNALEYAFVIAEEGPVDLYHLPAKFRPAEGKVAAACGCFKNECSEKADLIAALRQSNGNKTQAAKNLGVNRNTVWNRMRKYGVDLKKVVGVRGAHEG